MNTPFLKNLRKGIAEKVQNIEVDLQSYEYLCQHFL